MEGGGDVDDRSLSVLVADASQDQCDSLSMLSSALGYRMAYTAAGEQGLQIAELPAQSRSSLREGD